MSHQTSGEYREAGQYHADRAFLALSIFLICLFAFIIIRRGWLSDDAHITFRVVDNFIHGYGLAWNTIDRVQVYTHPLWLFILSLNYFIFRDFYWMPIIISIILSIGTMILLARLLPRSTGMLIAVLMVLAFSQAYVDYATSGLENPLSHLIVVMFFGLLLKGQPSAHWLGWLSFTASLGILTRMDLALVFVPALLYAVWRVKSRKGLWLLMVGQFPLLLWLLFSLWYYGFPFPNTAYAKLNTGIPRNEYLQQGWLYLEYTFLRDPITIFGMAIGLAIAFINPIWKTILPAISGLMYLFYVLAIGGDFMAGRFLTVPLLCFSIAAVQTEWLHHTDRRFIFLITFILIIGLLFPPVTTFYSGPLTWEERDENFINGIADERAFYAVGTSVLNYEAGHYPAWPWANEGLAWRYSGKKLYITEVVGMHGLFAGPNVHIVDVLAITDPLLARLPSKEKKPWRIGHFEREIPDGYIVSLQQRKNEIQDKNLSLYFDKLIELTRGDLFSFSRLKTIIEMNLGMYDHLIDKNQYRLGTHTR
jgi:arabinofuranosyltransferase